MLIIGIAGGSGSGKTTVVNKIIEYEKNPPSEPGFYRNALHCAYFEENPDAEGTSGKRYTHTTEESREYMLGQGFDIKRVYTTEPEVDPQFYSGWFSGGGPIHEALLRSNGFAWDGDRNDIIDGVNEGALYLFHRDHGVIEGELKGGGVEQRASFNRDDACKNVEHGLAEFRGNGRKSGAVVEVCPHGSGAVGVLHAGGLRNGL